jgi:monothiol glutaredoxin
MSLNEATKQKIGALIENSDVLLFMKGNRAAPQCGFSAKVVQILDGLLPNYETVDVLEDSEIREGIKEYSQWPTIPQLYVNGEFVGGCDIITELYGAGELHEKFGLPLPERRVPTLHVSDAARDFIRQHLERAPGKEVHLLVDSRFQGVLELGPRTGTEIEVQANGMTILTDLVSATRAEGLSIDLVETPAGARLKIDNPNGPAPVKQIAPAELKKMLDEGVKFEFFDVRAPEERAMAQIEGTRLLDEETANYIEGLSREAVLVFHCHHGGRSQQAAEHFRGLGFTNVCNLAGGIDAWSAEVDSGVPRY